MAFLLRGSLEGHAPGPVPGGDRRLSLRRPRAGPQGRSTRWCPTSTGISGWSKTWALSLSGTTPCPAAQTKLARHWDDLRQSFVSYYRPSSGKESELYKQFTAAADAVYKRHVHGPDEKHIGGLKQFLAENGDKIKAHFASLHSFEEERQTDPKTDFMRQRRWDQMQDLRKEAKGWITDLEAREKAFKADLMDLLDKQRKPQEEAVQTAIAEEAKKEAASAKTASDAESKTPAAVESRRKPRALRPRRRRPSRQRAVRRRPQKRRSRRRRQLRTRNRQTRRGTCPRSPPAGQGGQSPARRQSRRKRRSPNLGAKNRPMRKKRTFADPGHLRSGSATMPPRSRRRRRRPLRASRPEAST